MKYRNLASLPLLGQHNLFFPHSGFGEGQWFTDNSQIENVSSQSQVEGGLWLLSGWNGLVDFL